MFYQSRWLQGLGSYISPGTMGKGEGLESKTFRQIFQEWNSLSPSEGFDMSFSYYTVKCGRWFDTEAKAINTCGAWSSPGVSRAFYPQQLLQKSYLFSMPCCTWIWEVIFWQSLAAGKPCRRICPLHHKVAQNLSWREQRELYEEKGGRWMNAAIAAVKNVSHLFLSLPVKNN